MSVIGHECVTYTMCVYIYVLYVYVHTYIYIYILVVLLSFYHIYIQYIYIHVYTNVNPRIPILIVRWNRVKASRVPWRGDSFLEQFLRTVSSNALSM
jgi:hypothetical protein